MLIVMLVMKETSLLNQQDLCTDPLLMRLPVMLVVFEGYLAFSAKEIIIMTSVINMLHYQIERKS